MAYSVAMKRQMEKRLEEVFRECIDEMNAIEIPFGKITEVTVNYRAKSRWGLCVRTVGVYGYEYSINIRAELCHPDASEKGLKETIVHEILHTCPDCFCHTGEWKRLADIVNDCYGYNVKRGASAADLGMTEFYEKHGEVKKALWKYTVVCKKCGKIVAVRNRKCSLTKYPILYSHTACGGTLMVTAV